MGCNFFCYADCAMIETVISRGRADNKADSRQPPTAETQRYGFGELFTAIHYIERRYNVSCDYWGKNWDCPS